MVQEPMFKKEWMKMICLDKVVQMMQKKLEAVEVPNKLNKLTLENQSNVILQEKTVCLKEKPGKNSECHVIDIV